VEESSGVGLFVVEMKLGLPPTESPTNLPKGIPTTPTPTSSPSPSLPPTTAGPTTVSPTFAPTVVTDAYRATINANAHYHNIHHRDPYHSLTVPQTIDIFFHRSIPISVVGAQHLIPSNVPSLCPTRYDLTTPSLHQSRSPSTHQSLLKYDAPSAHISTTSLDLSLPPSLESSSTLSTYSLIAIPTTTAPISYVPLQYGVRNTAVSNTNNMLNKSTILLWQCVTNSFLATYYPHNPKLFLKGTSSGMIWSETNIQTRFLQQNLDCDNSPYPLSVTSSGPLTTTVRTRKRHNMVSISYVVTVEWLLLATQLNNAPFGTFSSVDSWEDTNCFFWSAVSTIQQHRIANTLTFCDGQQEPYE